MHDAEDTIVLYRPVGSRELELIRDPRFRKFPARLPDQPIFYPVLTEEYAAEIARDWNSKQTADGRGYVTRFHVRAAYLESYEPHVAGGLTRQEYWIPAEALDEFNANIVGTIEVVTEFRDGVSS